MNLAVNPPRRIGEELCNLVTDLITAAGRPLAVPELKNLIKVQNENLWNIISQKCPDYIRVIISSPKYSFAKYTSIEIYKGIDKRSIFYGLPNFKYDETKWEKFSCQKPVKSSQNLEPILQNPINNENLQNLNFDNIVPTPISTIALNTPPIVQHNPVKFHLYEKEGNWMEWKKASIGGISL